MGEDKNGRRVAARVLTGGLLGLAALGMPSVGAVIDTDDVCAEAAGEPSSFTDLAAAGVHRENVECLAFAAITTGTSATTYGPGSDVTRGQMATFVANMIDAADRHDAPVAPNVPGLPTALEAPDAFDDDDESGHEDNIDRLAAAGVVAGTTATTFAPTAPVTRAQMSSFIAQGLAYLTGSDLTIGADAFVDDETSPHERNIDRLAHADVVEGTGPGTFAPNGLVSRAQMASFIIQGLATIEADGLILPLTDGDNTDFAVLPSVAVDIAFVANPDGSTTDNRTYTATDLPAGAYRVTLVRAANVTRQASFFTFATTSSNPGCTGVRIVSPGDVTSDVTTVNGATVTRAPSVGGITPVNGSIAFTVDADGFESVVPVLHRDAGSCTYLQTDADGEPTEAFGVGGRIDSRPPEASAGLQTVDVVATEEAGDMFVGNPLGAATTPQRSFLYDSSDVFRIDPDGAGSQASTSTTLATFEAELSIGDSVQVDYRTDPSGDSHWVLWDVAPAAPVLADGAAPNTERVDLTITPSNPGLAAMDSNDRLVLTRASAGADLDCAATADNGTTSVVANVAKTADGDPATAAVFELTDAVAVGTWCYRATVVVDGETSPASAVLEAVVVTDVTAPTLVNVIVDETDDGVGSTTQVRFVWSEPVAVVDPTDFTVATGSSTLTGIGASASGVNVVVTFASALVDQQPDAVWTATAAAGAVRDLALTPNPSAAGADTFSY